MSVNEIKMRMTQFQIMRFNEPRSPQCTVGDGLKVDTSLIKRAGFGLFATRDFRKNEYITHYEGEMISRQEALARRSRGEDSHIKCLHLMGDCIDGIKGKFAVKGCGGASLVNDARSQRGNNSRFETRNGTIWLRATRDIAKGEELYASYGRTYWRIRGM